MTNYNERLDEILDDLVEGCEDGRNILGYRYDLGEAAKAALTQLHEAAVREAELHILTHIGESNDELILCYFDEDGGCNRDISVADRIAALQGQKGEE